MISAMVRALPIVLLLCLLPRLASAQPPVEVSGGYSLARDPRDEVTLPAGWTAGAGVGLTHSISAVADVSGQYKTIALVGSDARLSVHTVMGGVRASGRIGRLTEFGQVLAGVVRASGSAFGSRNVHHSLGIQPGVGADYPLAQRFAARAELDLRLIENQPDSSNHGYEYRFVAALVYRVNPR
jgi:hypothetical protein